MTKRALTALNESIEHWERLASGRRNHGEEHYSSDCALCQLFFKRGDDGRYCNGCPVMEATGCAECVGTPWFKADCKAEDYGYNSKQFRAAAKDQLEFLKSLLPKDKPCTQN